MRVLVTGGRDYERRHEVFAALDKLEAIHQTRLIVIEGGQRTEKNGRIVGGADYWANQWAQCRGRPCITHFADWHKDGRSAGPIRNSRMLSEWKPHIVLAFPGNRGTRDMVTKARSAGVEVLRWDHA